LVGRRPPTPVSEFDVTERSCDILIIGGGLVGASLACALDAQGWRCGLVEAVAAAGDSAPPGFDERNLALGAASLAALQTLGVLQQLRTPPAPIRRIHVSRQGDFGAVRLVAAEHGRDAFGGVVVARELGGALQRRLEALQQLQRWCPARVTAMQPTEAGWSVDVQRGDTVERIGARLLVGADGTHGIVRDTLGIGSTTHDYGQTLFVAAVASERPGEGSAWERFSASGPVALLPRSDGRYGSICGVANADAARVAALDDAGYLRYLQQRFGGRAGRFTRVGRRSAYPIVSHVADALTGARAVLVGNAAQTLHPVGAQGFNLGLRDALTLADLLGDHAAGSDPGDARLAAYPELRREDRERTHAFSDGLARLTGSESPPLHVLRSLGLIALDSLPGLRGPLVAGAMGYRGVVPRLARSA
jgi:2-octaprenyl-6-methoxyphenol hydroxylase